MSIWMIVGIVYGIFALGTVVAIMIAYARREHAIYLNELELLAFAQLTLVFAAIWPIPVLVALLGWRRERTLRKRYSLQPMP